MKVGIVVFPGTNCDRDMHHVLDAVAGADARYFWHTDPLDEDLDAIVLPGGFSYGDRLRSGAIAAHSRAMSGIKKMAEAGKPVLGVCNGFQILTEAGILPGALVWNSSAGFMCGWTDILVSSTRTPFTGRHRIGQKIRIPVANGEGRYHADHATLQSMRDNDQIVFRYASDINGSLDGIAGVSNKGGNVVGMMPHPERAAEPDINPEYEPALQIFTSMLEHAN